jgi:hypothetical protein
MHRAFEAEGVKYPSIFLIAIISIIKIRNSTEGSLGEVHILQNQPHSVLNRSQKQVGSRESTRGPCKLSVL